MISMAKAATMATIASAMLGDRIISISAVVTVLFIAGFPLFEAWRFVLASFGACQWRNVNCA
jgi:hypothetical protein